jgi:hypothetical protein
MGTGATAAGRRKPNGRGKKKNQGLGWYSWWPLALGLLITPIAVRAADVLALGGPNGMRLLYPYVVLMQQKMLGLSAENAATAAQVMMYVQFPVYGLFLMLMRRRRDTFGAIMWTAVIHFIMVIFLLGIAQMPQS